MNQPGYQGYDQPVTPNAVVAAGVHFAGGSFAKTASLITTLTPTGPRDEFQGWVRDVGTGLWSRVAVDAPLTLDLSFVGAGGLDQGALIADRVYLGYLIAQAGGANPMLLGARDITAAPVMPPGYVGLSIPMAPIWSDNPATEIVNFYHSGGRFDVEHLTRFAAASLFTGTTPTAVDVTDMAPADPSDPTLTIADKIHWVCQANNGNATPRTFSISNDSGVHWSDFVAACANAAGKWTAPTLSVDSIGTYGRALATVVYIDWNGTVTTGAYMYVKGVTLRGWA